MRIILLELFLATAFVGTSGFLFREHFVKKPILTTIVVILTIWSTYAIIEEGAVRLWSSIQYYSSSNKLFDAPSHTISTGGWVPGTWYGSEYDVQANILARVEGSKNFALFNNTSRLEIRTENGGKSLQVDGRSMSSIFEDMTYLRHGSNAGANLVAVNVKQGTQWTVAINGRPWDNWFDELFEYAVINGGVAIGVKIDNKWTIAVDGVPWSQRFDAVHNYDIFADGSVVAEVTDSGRRFIVRNGVEDPRLPEPRLIHISENGKIAWFNNAAGVGSVTVDYNTIWKSKFENGLSMVMNDNTGSVIAKVRSSGRITAIIDDQPWAHWYESEDTPLVGSCYSSTFLRLRRNNLSTFAVNDEIWKNWFDEIGSIGCESSGSITVAVQKDGLWNIVRNGKLVAGWFYDMRGWAINEDATLMATAVAEQSIIGTVSWRVVVFPIQNADGK